MSLHTLVLVLIFVVLMIVFAILCLGSAADDRMDSHPLASPAEFRDAELLREPASGIPIHIMHETIAGFGLFVILVLASMV